jgi:undecaprenyl pyrophosphate phosphatase UppP
VLGLQLGASHSLLLYVPRFLFASGLDLLQPGFVVVCLFVCFYSIIYIYWKKYLSVIQNRILEQEPKTEYFSLRMMMVVIIIIISISIICLFCCCF